MHSDELNHLREAVRNSPGNIPLRRYLAAALLKAQRFEEAEIEYKDALKLSPDDRQLKIGLAEVFAAQNKTSLGLVLIEELTGQSAPPPRTWLIYARLLLQNKQPREARDAYDNALALDPGLEDSFLESEINLQLNQGVKPEPQKLKLGGDLKPDDEDKIIDIERPKITFDEVGGMESMKEEIRMKIIHPLDHPEIYKAYGKKIGGGVLMFGPPGCGKTHLARATAGQIHANFITVGISDILNMYIGESERNLHAIFEKARRIKPCVLFIDEVDALGANRTDMRQSAGRHLINQFLAEMDGIQYSNDGVLILAATNAPWHLDPAFRRPGRFDRIIFVPPPDESGRKAILELKLKGKPQDDVDTARLAKRTKEYSGADLEAIVDIAIESKLNESMRKGAPVPITTSDLEQAIKRHQASTKEWFNTAKNYALFANESGLYDEILKYLNIRK